MTIISEFRVLLKSHDNLKGAMSEAERTYIAKFQELENAKITAGVIITVNGKERYVKTEVRYDRIT